MIRRRHTDPEHRRRIHSATRRSKRVGRAGRGFLAIVAALCALVFLVPMGGAAGSVGTGLSRMLSTLPIALIMIFFGWSLMAGRLGVPADRIVTDALDEELCPSCWDDLRGAHAERTDEGGTVDCPACGATWSMDGQH